MQLTIELPEDVARSLAGIANAQRKTVEQVALERLRSTVSSEGSPVAVLAAMKTLPKVNSTAADELDAVIAAGRLPVRDTTLFER
jgi:hypothetical protein